MYDCSRSEVIIEEKNGDPKELSFISPLRTGVREIDSATAFFYPFEETLTGASSTAVIFLHGLGDRNFNHYKYYAQGLNEAGFSVIFPVLPYFYHRRSAEKPHGNTFLSGSSDVIEKKFEHAVTDVRCLIDFCKKKGFQRIHCMGISFGGMIACLSMAQDPRIDRGIFVVTGGNFEHITWNSIATKVFRVRYEEDGSCSPERCRSLHTDFSASIMKLRNPADLESFPSCFRYDPSFFAGLINRDRVMMFTAKMDPFIPRRSSDDLWARLGKPKRIFLPAGHITSHLFFKRKILSKSILFFQNP